MCILQPFHDFRQRFDPFGIQRVIHPSAFRTIIDQTRFFEHSKMEGQSRLTSVEHLGQLTHTLLTVFELFQDAETSGLRQRVEQTGRFFDVRSSRVFHSVVIYQWFLICQQVRWDGIMQHS